MWHELTPLPMKVGAVQACRVVRCHNSSDLKLFVVGKKTWATRPLTSSEIEMQKDHQWDIETDLSEYVDELKIVRLVKNRIELFTGTGNAWGIMESDKITEPFFYGGRLMPGMKLSMNCLVGYSQS
jgi:hypothetical protein